MGYLAGRHLRDRADKRKANRYEVNCRKLFREVPIEVVEEQLRLWKEQNPADNGSKRRRVSE